MSVSKASKVPVRKVKIAVVGDGAVGKTSLLIRACGKEFPSVFCPTVSDLVDMEVALTCTQDDNCVMELMVIDTAGQSDYDRLRPLAYIDADVIAVCFSLNNHWSLENVFDKWLREIGYHTPGSPVVLVGTKSDLLATSQDKSKGDRTVSEVLKMVREKCAEKDVLPDRLADARLLRAESEDRPALINAVVSCSAKDGTNVRDVLELLAYIGGYYRVGKLLMSKKKYATIPAPMPPLIPPNTTETVIKEALQKHLGVSGVVRIIVCYSSSRTDIHTWLTAGGVFAPLNTNDRRCNIA